MKADYSRFKSCHPHHTKNRLLTSNGVDRRFSLYSKMLKYA
nr:MAG TPA: hypothetical protein [Caudoviricetes sp.]